MTGDYLTQAREVYLEVYGIMTERADYLQPEQGADHFLPHDIIELLTSTALVSAAAGIFKEFGKQAAGRLQRVSFRKAKAVRIPDDELIKILSEAFKADAVDRSKVKIARAQLMSLLVDAGFAKSHAIKISHEIITAFLRAIGDDEEK
jgi:hypothetical protein